MFEQPGEDLQAAHTERSGCGCSLDLGVGGSLIACYVPQEILHMYSLFASHQVCLARKHKASYVFGVKLINFCFYEKLCSEINRHHSMYLSWRMCPFLTFCLVRRTLIFKWRTCAYEPSCPRIVSASLWRRATWRSRMAVNGSRSVTPSGAILTAESSVACLASLGRGSTMPESTSEYTTTVCVVLGNSKGRVATEINGIIRYFGTVRPNKWLLWVSGYQMIYSDQFSLNMD